MRLILFEDFFKSLLLGQALALRIFDGLSDRGKDIGPGSIHPDDLALNFEAEASALARGEGMDVEYRIFTKTGQLRYIREVGEPMVDESGWRVSCSGTIQDITQQKLLQEQLATSLADSRLVARLSKLGTYEWDWVRDRLVACSEEFARIVELSVDEALQTFTSREVDHSYIHPDDRERYAAVESEAVAKGKGFSKRPVYAGIIFKSAGTRLKQAIDFWVSDKVLGWGGQCVNNLL